jgi:hypothetical protein
MRTSDYEQFRDLMGRKSLSEGQRQFLREYLAAHPESRVQWELERCLDSCLDRLSDVPVSSNFTARVLQAAVQTPAPRTIGAGAWGWRTFVQWIPRLAVAMLVMGVGVMAFQQYDTTRHRQMAHQLAVVSQVAQLPRMEWLKDFDTIDRLSKVQVADQELLAALQ